MKQKKIVIGTILSLALFGLSACGRSNLDGVKPSELSQPAASQTKNTTAQSQSRSSTKSFSVAEASDFVQKFLTAYTTYTSLNAQKEALKPLLTVAMQNELAVDNPVSSDLDRVRSVGEALSAWRNDKNGWLGLVTIKVND
jgi:hypothetical protein